MASVRPIAFSFFKMDLHVVFHRVLTDVKDLTDFLIALAESHLLEHLKFASRKVAGCVIESANCAATSRGSEDFPAKTSRTVSQT